MSRISFSQFITEDGKIQIDITNTTGRAQPLSREVTISSENPEHVNMVRDQDEPCSLIVSLRSSHPQFFFYRGPQPTMVTSNRVASPLQLLNGGSGGVGGHHHHGHSSHHHTGSALWAHLTVDATVLEVSREAWREHNFAKVAPVAGGAASSTVSNNGGNSNSKSDESDSRPLLVREEVADCVLLPGERRTFFLEVSNPAMLTRLLSPTLAAMPATAAMRSVGGGVGDLRLQPSRLHSGSEGGERSSDTPKAPFRDQTDMIHMEGRGQRPRGQQQQQQQQSYNGGPASRSRGQENGVHANRRDSNSVDSGGDATDTDEYGRSSSRQPLSIIHDSSTARASVDAVRYSNTSAQRQRPPRGPGDAPDSLRSSGDYVVPPSSSDASDSALVNDVRGIDSRRPSQQVDHHNNNSGGATSPAPVKRSESTHHAPPPLPSRNPVFFVYYHPLGDENKCVDRARKWIAKEQHTYHEWRESLVRTIVQLERKREQGWTVRDDHAVLPQQPRLEVRRILPPSLGELVRWRSDDGSSGCEGDVMQPSPVTVAAFHYYYTRLPSVGGSGSSAAHGTSLLSAASAARRSASTLSNRHGAPDIPPSFAATRANRVSKKARKMFDDDRRGAGTLIMPLRVPPTSANGGGRNGSTTFSGSVTPVKVPSSSSAGRPPSSQQQQQQQGRGGSLQSVASDSPFTSAAPPQQPLSSQGYSRKPSSLHTRAARENGNGRDEGTEYYAGSATPSESTLRESGAWRPRVRAGRGLALLDDSVTAPLSPSGCASSEAYPSSGDFLGSAADHKANPFNASISSTSRWGRTNTLDPDAAELAARTSTPQLHRDNALYSPRDARPSLPSFPLTLEAARSLGGSGSGERARSSPDLNAPLFPSTAKRLANSNSSSHLNAQLAADAAAAAAAAAAESAEAEEEEAANPGSFVANLIQSFCGRRGSKAESASGVVGSAEEDMISPHVRDISSAPPQRVTYRRPLGPGTNSSFTGSGVVNQSFSGAVHSQAQWVAARSKVARRHAKSVAQVTAETISAGAVQIFDFLYEHGPTAMEGLVTVLNALKDYVFTPGNVNMMETVITPMVIVFAVVAVLHLIFFGGGGGVDEALSPLLSGSL